MSGNIILPAVLKSKIIYATRDLTAASGDVSYTGVGFKPTVLVIVGGVDAAEKWGIGFSNTVEDMRLGSIGNVYVDGSACIGIYDDVNNGQTAIVKTFDDDGFTLTWTKVLNPTSTAKLIFLCLKAG